MYQDHSAPIPECQCFPVPPEYWTTHYGAVDPATTLEPNPACPEHFPEGEDEPGSPFPPFPVTQEFTPQGDSGGFDPWDQDGDSPTIGPRLTRNAEGVHVPEESVLRGGDRIPLDPAEVTGHRNGARVVRGEPSPKVLRATDIPPHPVPYPSPAREPSSLQAHLDKSVQRYNDQAHVDGILRDWADRAEDYLAQENPPLPPFPVDEEVLKNEILFVQDDDVLLTVRVDPPKPQFSDEVRDECHGLVSGVLRRRGLMRKTAWADAEVIVDAVLKVVLDAMNGGRR